MLKESGDVPILRENKSGTFEECGHISRGQYPPESCPGEIDDEFPIEETTSVEGVENWQDSTTQVEETLNTLTFFVHI